MKKYQMPTAELIRLTVEENINGDLDCTTKGVISSPCMED